MTLDSAAFQLLNNALQATDLRQAVYSNNIANVDTPGFKRSDVEFESLLQGQMSSTPAATLGEETIPIQTASSSDWQNWLGIQPTVVQDNTTSMNNNGNNVDIDAEMSNLAENQIQHNAIVQDLSTRIQRLKTAINN